MNRILILPVLLLTLLADPAAAQELQVLHPHQKTENQTRNPAIAAALAPHRQSRVTSTKGAGHSLIQNLSMSKII